jgi:hypothetical protein
MILLLQFFTVVLALCVIRLLLIPLLAIDTVCWNKAIWEARTTGKSVCACCLHLHR